MKILSHRGYWLKESEKNSAQAFCRSFDAGFGTETDLRDADGKIVISHDIPRGGEIEFEDLLRLMDGRNLPLALNIKADGMADIIYDLLEKYSHTNYFTFDMSIPDMINQLKTNIKVYAGLSDVLNPPVLLDKCEGVWLDCFYSDWFKTLTIDNLLNLNFSVCIVSAELHKREVVQQWNIIKDSKYINDSRLMLCTDKPNDARNFFNE